MSAPAEDPSIDLLRASLRAAIERFNSSDDHVLLNTTNTTAEDYGSSVSVAERAIAHRLAYHFENELRRAGILREGNRLSIDCDYNRHLHAQKKLISPDAYRRIVLRAGRKALPAAPRNGFFQFSVAPDILLHERVSDAQNLVIIELKKESNKELREYDELKLALFTAPLPDGFGYKLGVHVIARDDLPAEQCRLEIAKEYCS
jgi:hypothetical protein